jgi:hypothetical protein
MERERARASERERESERARERASEREREGKREGKRESERESETWGALHENRQPRSKCWVVHYSVTIHLLSPCVRMC